MKINPAHVAMEEVRAALGGHAPYWALEWPALQAAGLVGRDEFTADEVRREASAVLDAIATIVTGYFGTEAA